MSTAPVIKPVNRSRGLGTVSGTKQSIQTKTDHQSHGDTDADEHPHHHGTHGTISFGKLPCNVDSRKLVDDKVADPHEYECDRTAKNGINQVYNNWRQRTEFIVYVFRRDVIRIFAPWLRS